MKLPFFSIAASLVCYFSLEPVSAVPTKVPNKDLASDVIQILVPDRSESTEKSFTIKKEIAEKGNFLKELMANGKSKFVIQESELPDLVNAAHEIEFKSLLKFSLSQLCTEIKYKTKEDFEALKQKIPDFIAPLLLCKSDKEVEKLNLSDNELGKRTEFMTECPKSEESEYGKYQIANPSLNCLNYIQKNEWDLVLPSNVYLGFDNLNDFANDVEILKTLDMNIELSLSGESADLNLEKLYQSLNNVPNLSLLGIVDCQQQTLDMSKFPEMPRLLQLGISQCQLENLSSFLERDFPELVDLMLPENQIEEIGTIKSMPRLESLILTENQISNMHHLLQSNLDNLRELGLSQNCIKTMPKIELMPNLKTLYLSENQIENVSELMESKLEKLEDLNLEKNKIQTIPKIKAMPQLEALFLSENQIENVSGLMESKLEKLKSLNLKKNKIQTIPKIKAMQNLKMLDFSENQIENVSGLMEIKLEKLFTLNLSKNKIQTIPKISIQTARLIFDLSGNQIKDIYELLKSEFTNFVIFDLSENKIQVIPITILTFLRKQMGTVNMAYNQIQDVEEIKTILGGAPVYGLDAQLSHPEQVITDKKSWMDFI